MRILLEQEKIKKIGSKFLLYINRYTTTRYTAILILLILVSSLPFLLASNHVIPTKTIGDYYTQSYRELEIIDENTERATVSKIYLFLKNFTFESTIMRYETELYDNTEILHINAYYKLNNGEKQELYLPYAYESLKLLALIHFPYKNFSSGDKLEIVLEYIYKTERKILEVGEKIGLGAKIFAPADISYNRNVCFYRIIYPNNFKYVDMHIGGEKSEEVTIFADFDKISDKKALTLCIFPFLLGTTIEPKIEFEKVSKEEERLFMNVRWEKMTIELTIEEEFFHIECSLEVRNNEETALTGLPNPLFYFLNYKKYKTYSFCMNCGCDDLRYLDEKEETFLGNEKAHTRILRRTERDESDVILNPKEKGKLEIEVDVPHDLNLDPHFIDSLPPFSILALDDFMSKIEFFVKLPENTQLYSSVPRATIEDGKVTWREGEVRDGDLFYYTLSFLNGTEIPKDIRFQNYVYLTIISIYIIMVFVPYYLVCWREVDSKVTLAVILSFGMAAVTLWWAVGRYLSLENIKFLEIYFDRLKVISLYYWSLIAFINSLLLGLFRSKIKDFFGYLDRRTERLKLEINGI